MPERDTFEHKLYSLAMRLYELNFQQTRENTEEILRLKAELARYQSGHALPSQNRKRKNLGRTRSRVSP